MAVDLLTNSETLDFELGATGDIQTTDEVVKQDAWKMIVLPKGNFTFDPELGSFLYRIPRFGNTRASRELTNGYIRLAVDELLRDKKLALDAIEVSEVTSLGFKAKITYRDLTTNDSPSTLDF